MRDHPLRLTLPYALVSAFVVTEGLVPWQPHFRGPTADGLGLLLDLGGRFLQIIGWVAVIAQTRSLVHRESEARRVRRRQQRDLGNARGWG